jgi:hypothetical protein
MYSLSNRSQLEMHVLPKQHASISVWADIPVTYSIRAQGVAHFDMLIHVGCGDYEIVETKLYLLQ